METKNIFSSNPMFQFNSKKKTKWTIMKLPGKTEEANRKEEEQCDAVDYLEEEGKDEEDREEEMTQK